MGGVRRLQHSGLHNIVREMSMQSLRIQGSTVSENSGLFVTVATLTNMLTPAPSSSDTPTFFFFFFTPTFLNACEPLNCPLQSPQHHQSPSIGDAHDSPPQKFPSGPVTPLEIEG